MIALVWIVAIIIGAFLQNLYLLEPGSSRPGALTVIIIYGILFAIAGAITRYINIKRQKVKETTGVNKETDIIEDEEIVEIKDDCDFEGITGTLEKTQSKYVFKSKSGHEKIFLTTSNLDVKAKGNFVIIRENNVKFKYKVANPQKWNELKKDNKKETNQVDNNQNIEKTTEALIESQKQISFIEKEAHKPEVAESIKTGRGDYKKDSEELNKISLSYVERKKVINPNNSEEMKNNKMLF